MILFWSKELQLLPLFGWGESHRWAWQGGCAILSVHSRLVRFKISMQQWGNAPCSWNISDSIRGINDRHWQRLMVPTLFWPLSDLWMRYKFVPPEQVFSQQWPDIYTRCHVNDYLLALMRCIPFMLSIDATVSGCDSPNISFLLWATSSNTLSASSHLPCDWCMEPRLAMTVIVWGCFSPKLPCIVCSTWRVNVSASSYRPWLWYIMASRAFDVRVTGCVSPNTALIADAALVSRLAASSRRPWLQ